MQRFRAIIGFRARSERSTKSLQSLLEEIESARDIQTGKIDRKKAVFLPDRSFEFVQPILEKHLPDLDNRTLAMTWIPHKRCI